MCAFKVHRVLNDFPQKSHLNGLAQIQSCTADGSENFFLNTSQLNGLEVSLVASGSSGAGNPATETKGRVTLNYALANKINAVEMNRPL